MQKLLCWGWMLLLFIGCGAQYEAKYNAGSEATSSPPPASDSTAETLLQQPVFEDLDEADALAQNDAGGKNGQAIAEKPPQEPQAEQNEAPKNIERKIIYTGQVSLVVEEFTEMETAIPELVKEFGGYLKSADINRTEGRWRNGRWVARIPSARFSEFLQAVSKLGIAEHQEQSTEDVTMEFLDVEARIASKKQVEERILKLLEDRDGKLSEIVEAEHKLAEVRSEIESMQGRLRYLQNQTVFSTVTIEVREEKDYVPEQAPDFGGRIGKAWQDSLRALKRASQEFVIGVVAFVPWILPLGVLFGGAFLLLRWLVKRFSGGKKLEKK